MRSAVTWAVAAWLAAGGAVVERACAADLTPPGADRVLFFSGVDLWRGGVFSHAGALWAPKGLDFDGFVLKLAGGAGNYRYLSGALGSAEVTGRMFSFSVLPGWRFRRGSFTITAFLGIETQHHALSPDDVTSNLRGSYVGVRGGVELWYEPTPASMLAADVSATSIGPSYSGRVAFGWRIANRLYAGPEIAGFAYDNNYRQLRIGAQITALKTGPVEWSAGFGWARDSDDRTGAYGRLGLLMRSGLL